MASLPRNCCAITANITASADLCTNVKGGATDLRLACIKNVYYVEYGCANAAADVDTSAEPGTVYWIGTWNGLTTLPDVTVDPNTMTPFFYKVDTRDKTLEHVWELTYAIDTGTLANTESLNFSVDVKDRAFYCAVKAYIGQEVVAYYEEKGSSRKYLVGRSGGLTVTSIAGGTGTDEFTPTTFTITAEDAEDIFMELLVQNPSGYTITAVPAWASGTSGLTAAEFTEWLMDHLTN